MASQSVPITDIFGVNINALTMPMAIDIIEGWIERGEKHYVCICTVHSIMTAQDNPAYMDVLNQASLRTSDGMPLVWLSRRAGHEHVARVAGPDLLPAIAARSAETGHRHYFYGGSPGVVSDLASVLEQRYPGLQVAGWHQPDMQPIGAIESDDVIHQINATYPDILWIGLGSPKQDIWAANHLDKLNAKVVIAVGAAFDFHTGRIKRAPEYMQNRGLEWLYRLSQDPGRLWKRYVSTNSRFVWKLIRTY